VSTEAILPVELQLLSLGVLILFSGWVFWLIRTRQLHLREALIWLLTTLVAIAVTASPALLQWSAKLVGIRVPANALFGAGILYLVVNVLAVTISVSKNTVNIRRLAQECALLRAEVEALRAASASRPAEPAPPGERHDLGSARR
jgi:hypothetical protein